MLYSVNKFFSKFSFIKQYDKIRGSLTYALTIPLNVHLCNMEHDSHKFFVYFVAQIMISLSIVLEESQIRRKERTLKIGTRF